jgi:hypothetical protein
MTISDFLDAPRRRRGPARGGAAHLPRHTCPRTGAGHVNGASSLQRSRLILQRPPLRTVPARQPKPPPLPRSPHKPAPRRPRAPPQPPQPTGPPPRGTAKSQPAQGVLALQSFRAPTQPQPLTPLSKAAGSHPHRRHQKWQRRTTRSSTWPRALACTASPLLGARPSPSCSSSPASATLTVARRFAPPGRST